MSNLLKINEPITFGEQGNIQNFDPFGIDVSELSISWTIAQTAGFTVALTIPPTDLRLMMSASPFTHAGAAPKQQIFVYANGIWIGFHTLTAHEEFGFTLPRNAISTRGTRISLVIPTATSPKSLNLSSDVRSLGVALSKLVILSAN
jgi:hypothetical protein